MPLSHALSSDLFTEAHQENFWRMVDIWTGAVDGRDYGFFHVTALGQSRRAHRCMHALVNGPIIDEEVTHLCDVPRCVRPSHLGLDDHAGNMRDMVERGRRVGSGTAPPLHRGEDQHLSKLTEADIVAIRRDPRDGATVAKIYGVSKTAISRVRLRKTWRHVPG
jgi:hypothetical protein